MGSNGLVRIAMDTVRKYSMIDRGDGVVVGVSGGPDSVALLHFLSSIAREYNLQLHVAHVNHMIRGASADEDERFVSELARSLGIPVTVDRVDVPRLARQLGVTVEDAGRDARYGLYRRICVERGFSRAAVAHHADDQAETVLMRILRGTGLRGLAGIPPIRELGGHATVIRPFIEVTRAQIEQYCSERALATRTDPTNVDTQYLRNKVRCELLPLLEREYNSNIRAGLARLARLASLDEQYVEEQAVRLFDSARAAAAGSADARDLGRQVARVWLDLDLMRQAAEPVASRAFALAFAEVAGDKRDLYWPNIDAMTALVRTGNVGNSIDLPGGLRARLTYDTIVIEHAAEHARAGADEPGVIAEPITEQIVVAVRIPGAMPLTWAKATVYAALGDNAAADAAAGRRQPWEFPSTQELACMASRALADSGSRGLRVEASGIGREWTVFDADQVDLDALVIRPWRAGDRIRPFGMSGAKKLSDLFVDEKVPRPVRSRLAVLAMGDEALWVMGVRASAEGAVTSSTRRIAVLAADMDDSIDDA
ncbi:MAG TPA: tRNA lysidine(34) synthetase TilS [Bacillota bacterium]|nr:tRNA lysidine(34) synthetase TilS [Bacillota bacterium]